MALSLRRSALVPLLAIVLAGGTAEANEKVSFGQVSPTATGWPGIAAQAKGFFAENGIDWDVVSIGVSPGQQAVASGSLNIMHNTCNAVVSFAERGGTGAPLTMATVSPHPGVLIAKKGLKDARELKGKIIGTSSIQSGSTVALNVCSGQRASAKANTIWLPVRAQRRSIKDSKAARSTQCGWCRRSRSPRRRLASRSSAASRRSRRSSRSPASPPTANG